MGVSGGKGWGWVALWGVSVLGLGLTLHQRDVEQRERWERLEQRLTALHEELRAARRAPAAVLPLVPSSLPADAPRGGVDEVALEALAQRVAGLVAEQLHVPAGAPAAPEPRAEPRAEPSREQRTALEQAQRTLEGALSRGRLSREDVEEMRRQMDLVQDPEARLELRRRILVGINTNALMPEDPHFIVP